MVLVGAFVAGAFLFMGSDDEASTITLVPAAGSGPVPLLDGSFAEAPDPTLAQAVSETDARVKGEGSLVIATEKGDTPGMFGGSPTSDPCDAAGLGQALDADEARAGVVLATLGADTTLGLEAAVTRDQIATFPALLTPVVLQKDVRVTYQGWDAGALVPRQAVLQRGTAVLVDSFGVPRLRCASGNLLTPAEPVSGSPTFAGDVWTDFDPGALVVVGRADAAVTAFELIDLASGETFTRNAGGEATSGQVVRHATGAFEITAPDGWQTDAAATSGVAEGAPQIKFALDMAAYNDGTGGGGAIVDLTDAAVTFEQYVDVIHRDLAPGEASCPVGDVGPFSQGDLTGVGFTIDTCQATFPDGSVGPYAALVLAVSGPDGRSVGVVAYGAEVVEVAPMVLESFNKL